jgi:hypothetical protein
VNFASLRIEVVECSVLFGIIGRLPMNLVELH